MSTAVPPLDAPSPAGLSQVERVVDTYIAPKKTFDDIRRSASWWLPFLIGVVITYAFMFAVQSKVGWDQVVQNNLRENPKQMEQMEKAPPDQQAKTLRIITMTTKGIFIAFPLLTLIVAAICSGIFMLSCNFGLGGRGTYSQYLAVWMYAALPLAIHGLLTIILLFAGGGGENFRLDNPVGTNAGFYLDPTTSPWLIKLLTSFDLFQLWSLALLSLGCAAVARISVKSAAMVVFGWWLLWTLCMVGIAAVRG